MPQKSPKFYAEQASKVEDNAIDYATTMREGGAHKSGFRMADYLEDAGDYRVKAKQP